MRRCSLCLPVLLACVMLTPNAMAQTPATIQNANPWLTLAPFPEPSEELLGATANGKLYVFCGLGPGWTPKALVYEYDPASNDWTKKRPMALPSHHVAFASYKDKIYAFGGFTLPDSGPPSWRAIDNAWEYDPATDTWKALAPMPTKRGAAAASVVNGKIYVIGGANSLPNFTESGIHPARPHQVLATVEEYDPESNTWRERRPMLVARNHHAAAGIGNKLYAVGGRVSGAFIGVSDVVDLLEIYDPESDLWTRGEKMPTARSAISAAVWDGKLLIAGGEAQDRRYLAAFKAVEIYDPAVNRWNILPSMPHPRHGLAVGVIGDKFYAVSGDGQSAGSGIEHSAVPFVEALQLDRISK
jgi:N-acetylneuraminic acid mutarotase